MRRQSTIANENIKNQRETKLSYTQHGKILTAQYSKKKGADTMNKNVFNFQTSGIRDGKSDTISEIDREGGNTTTSSKIQSFLVESGCDTPTIGVEDLLEELDDFVVASGGRCGRPIVQEDEDGTIIQNKIDFSCESNVVTPTHLKRRKGEKCKFSNINSNHESDYMHHKFLRPRILPPLVASPESPEHIIITRILREECILTKMLSNGGVVLSDVNTSNS